MDAYVRTSSTVYANQRRIGTRALQPASHQIVQDHLESLNSASTRRAARNRFNRYDAFCTSKKIPTFPIVGSVVALHIHDLSGKATEAEAATGGKAYDTHTSVLNTLRRLTAQVWKGHSEEALQELTAHPQLRDFCRLARHSSLIAKKERLGATSTATNGAQPLQHNRTVPSSVASSSSSSSTSSTRVTTTKTATSNSSTLKRITPKATTTTSPNKHPRTDRRQALRTSDDLTLSNALDDERPPYWSKRAREYDDSDEEQDEDETPPPPIIRRRILLSEVSPVLKPISPRAIEECFEGVEMPPLSLGQQTVNSGGGEERGRMSSSSPRKKKIKVGHVKQEEEEDRKVEEHRLARARLLEMLKEPEEPKPPKEVKSRRAPVARPPPVAKKETVAKKASKPKPKSRTKRSGRVCKKASLVSSETVWGVLETVGGWFGFSAK